MHRLYLVLGDPGAGKTTLALQFLLEGIRREERVLYISLSETKEELEVVAESHGWSIDQIAILDLPTVEQKLGPITQSTVFRPSEIELGRTSKVLLDAVEETKATRIVFDSLSEMRLLAQDPLRYRRQMLALKQFFSGRDCTVILLDDRGANTPDLQVESIAHGVITLEKVSPNYGIPRRRLEVVKLRGLDFRSGKHDFIIRRGGLEVFPRLIASEHHTEFPANSASSGIAELDGLLGGGLDRGTSMLIMGPAGAGKSTLATQFLISAARRGEKGVLYTFDETLLTLRKRSAALGLDLDAGDVSSHIELRHIDPAELSPGALAHELRERSLKEGLRFVVIDSLNGYMKAMPNEEYLILHLHELLTFLNQQGVITIMVLSQHGVMGHMQTPADLTYLADSVLLLRFFEALGMVRKAISVLKKRSGDHERTIREMGIGTGGVRVGPPLTNFQGVLTGTPIYSGADDQMLEQS